MKDKIAKIADKAFKAFMVVATGKIIYDNTIEPTKKADELMTKIESLYGKNNEISAKLSQYDIVTTIPHRANKEVFEKHYKIHNPNKEDDKNDKIAMQKIQNALTELRELNEKNPIASAYTEVRLAQKLLKEDYLKNQELGKLKPDSPKAQNNKSSGQMR